MGEAEAAVATARGVVDLDDVGEKFGQVPPKPSLYKGLPRGIVPAGVSGDGRGLLLGMIDPDGVKEKLGQARHA